MKKKKLLIVAGIAVVALISCATLFHKSKSYDDFSLASHASDDASSIVYFTKEITPESLVRIYEALGVDVSDRSVAVKISTGENGSNYLRPELIGNFVKTVNGTIVECNTAYGGKRSKSESHWQIIKEHGFMDIAPCDIMDEEGSIEIPVTETKWIKSNLVGSHISRYDFMVNLAHFKGHMMGGFGGVLKNASIGVASASGKAYIHSAGRSKKIMWGNLNQDSFLESMATAAQSVHNYFGGNVIYINVMNNMSVDCDCVGHPATPELQDMGIAASLDPVAVDQACLDMVFNITPKEGNDNRALIKRIRKLHGTHTVDYAESLGLGNRTYKLVCID